MRAVALDVHRDFCEVAIVEEGRLRSAGRIETRPETLELFAQSLDPSDWVALEVTGNAWAIARILEAHVARVIVVSPNDTGIRQARAKTDRLDARTLAKLLWAGELDGVWAPDERVRVMRRRLARRAQLVRARSRAKNEIHAVLMRNLKDRPPAADLFGVKRRAWLAEQQLAVCERETVDAGLSDPALFWSTRYGSYCYGHGQDWVYAALNRGKRAVALDVVSPAGAEVLHRLLRESDVFVTNLRAGVLAQLGLDAETLCGVNPRLVYAKGGGFAAHGPLADLPCQDTVGMAYGGLMDLLSSTGEPNYPPGGLSDVLTGTMLASAIMAALVRRATTGRGGVVGATQTQSLMWLQQLPLGMAGSLGATMPRFSPERAGQPAVPRLPGEGRVDGHRLHLRPPLAPGRPCPRGRAPARGRALRHLGGRAGPRQGAGRHPQRDHGAADHGRVVGGPAGARACGARR